MPSVLTTKSIVVCGHTPPSPPAAGTPVPGTLTFVAPAQGKLRIGGAFALLEADLLAAQMPTCPQVPPPNKKCLKVTAVTAGQAVKLRVGGKPVMLSGTLAGLTDGTPPSTLAVKDVQTKLSAR